ncbi:HWE histidine kinase domain-containing protein [Sphingomonas sp. PAMC 26621]|uniref:HWE histidine kinase domain-containing protein n=1 Tax=Sphingomonas sp. PAMC 26621 TaxID=1112213 RepID=UPI0002F55EC3|nr:HWE histidine kinase domain-containing protein [Sphingomonas sp. PAMC 26621]
MADVTAKSEAQKEGEAAVDTFRKELGPFVVAAQKTRMPMVFTDVEPGHPVIFANDAFLTLTGYSREEVLAKSFQSLLAVGVDSETMETVETAFRGECDHEPEIHYKRKNGSEFWASMFVSPVCDDSGTVVQHFVSLVDLTNHRQDNARCKMLIDELNHRVKNTLSTVQSIVTQALRRPAEPAVIREAIESRILALSRSHDLLTHRNWEGAGLHDLVDTALHPFKVVAGCAERFTITGGNVHLSPKAALSVAIALNELATNAVKYGALSNDAGNVAIDWTVSSAPQDRLVLRWREHDGPPVVPPTHKGFGSWVIERGLPHELGGNVTLEYLRAGLACTIDIPISSGAQA